ncbi:MAG: DNA methyltransferase, partial [bacterium]
MRKERWDSEYNIFLEEFRKEDKDFIDMLSSKQHIEESDLEKLDQILKNIKLVSVNTKLKQLKVSREEQLEWKYENAYRIVRTAASDSVKALVDKKKKFNKNNVFSVLSSRDRKLYIVKSDYDANTMRPRVQLLFAEDYLKTSICDLWVDIKTTGLEPEGGVYLKSGKKPEELIHRVIDLTTIPGEIVMDFFVGTGTTCAVAHK